jgi:hypothetical protein
MQLFLIPKMDMFLKSTIKLHELRLFADIWQAGCDIPLLYPCEQKLFGSSSARSYKDPRAHASFSSLIQLFIILTLSLKYSKWV